MTNREKLKALRKMTDHEKEIRFHSWEDYRYEELKLMELAKQEVDLNTFMCSHCEEEFDKNEFRCHQHRLYEEECLCDECNSYSDFMLRKEGDPEEDEAYLEYMAETYRYVS